MLLLVKNIELIKYNFKIHSIRTPSYLIYKISTKIVLFLKKGMAGFIALCLQRLERAMLCNTAELSNSYLTLPYTIHQLP